MFVGVCLFCFNISKMKRNHDLVPLEDGGSGTIGEISIPTNGDVRNTRKQRRTRQSFSNHQLNQLEFTFSNSHYPDVATRQILASALSINEDRIHV